MEDYTNTLVIDADGHVNEGDIDFKPLLPEKYKSLAPVRLKDNRGGNRLLLEGRIWPATEGPGPGVTGPMTKEARKGRPGMTEPKERLKDMDLEGIDVAVIFGTQIALTVNGLMDKGLAAALCHAVNEWVLEYCSADPRRLRGVGLIPCQDPAAAVQELHYLAENGATTAMLPTNVYGRNMGDPMFDPIYTAAQEIGLPLSVHPQTGHDGVPGVSGVMGAGSRRFYKYVYVHTTAFPFELMIAMMHMLGEGVFDRYPRLKVAFMEGAAGGCPSGWSGSTSTWKSWRRRCPRCSGIPARSSGASSSSCHASPRKPDWTVCWTLPDRPPCCTPRTTATGTATSPTPSGTSSRATT